MQFAGNGATGKCMPERIASTRAFARWSAALKRPVAGKPPAESWHKPAPGRQARRKSCRNLGCSRSIRCWQPPMPPEQSRRTLISCAISWWSNPASVCIVPCESASRPLKRVRTVDGLARRVKVKARNLHPFKRPFAIARSRRPISFAIFRSQCAANLPLPLPALLA